MRGLRHAALAMALSFAAGIFGGCGGDDSNSGASTCHCDFGDSCEEYSSGCAFTECESNGMDVKSNGSCPLEGVVGICRCASEDLTTYYTADYDDPEGDCDFFCDDGVYEAQ